MRLNYKTRKLLSEETVNKQQIEFAIEKAKLNLSSDILATKEALSDARAKLEELKTTYPLDVNAIMVSSSAVEGYEAGLSKLEALKEELGL